MKLLSRSVLLALGIVSSCASFGYSTATCPGGNNGCAATGVSVYTCCNLPGNQGLIWLAGGPCSAGPISFNQSPANANTCQANTRFFIGTNFYTIASYYDGLSYTQ